MTEKPVCLKVWRPSGGIQKVTHIAGNTDHFGNEVAEGRLPKEEFWQSCFQAEKRHHNQSVARRNKIIKNHKHQIDHLQEIIFGRSLWVQAYLDYMESQNDQ